MKFTINMASHNEAVSGDNTTASVADILEQVANEVRAELATSGTVRDDNGNRVGSWKLVRDDGFGNDVKS